MRVYKRRALKGLAPVGVFIDVNRPYTEFTSRYSDMLKDIETKRVLLFGAGDSLRIWLERFSQDLDIVCVFDNSREKWGNTIYGLPIRPPEELYNLIDNNSRLIITSIYHKEIGKQLDIMNIRDYYVFIDGWNYRKES